MRCCEFSKSRAAPPGIEPGSAPIAGQGPAISKLPPQPVGVIARTGMMEGVEVGPTAPTATAGAARRIVTPVAACSVVGRKERQHKSYSKRGETRCEENGGRGIMPRPEHHGRLPPSVIALVVPPARRAVAVPRERARTTNPAVTTASITVHPKPPTRHRATLQKDTTGTPRGACYTHRRSILRCLTSMDKRATDFYN
jgi:hypothetical protein